MKNFQPLLFALAFLFTTSLQARHVSEVTCSTHLFDLIEKNGAATSTVGDVDGDGACSLRVDANGSFASCEGANDGSIDLTVTGNVGNYTVDWFHIPGTDNPEDLNGLAPDLYIVFVYEPSTGCTDTDATIIFSVFDEDALAPQNCAACSEIRFDFCEGEATPDLEALLTSNDDYRTGNSFKWYEDNSGIQGNPRSTPGVNTSTQATSFYWVSQQGFRCESEATRVRVRVEEGLTPALAPQNCATCSQIRFDFCEGDATPDLEELLTYNADYEAGASFLWYKDNSGSPGDPRSTPGVNTNTKKTRFYWVSQLTDCKSPARRVRVRVRKTSTVALDLPAIGCSGAQVDLAAWVSDSRNIASGYTFYDEDPAANSGATPIGTATATNGVVNFGQYVVVPVQNGAQTYWVKNTVLNGCGSVASSTLNAPAQTASLNTIPPLTVDSGDPVNLTFSGQNTTMILWFDLAVFNNPNIGIVGTLGSGGLAFTASNATGSAQTATIRVIPYNGNCAGTPQDFTITVNPGPPNRQAQSLLSLSASQDNLHEISLKWDINYAFDLIRFEVEKMDEDGDFKAIGKVDWTGNGSYSFTDPSEMHTSNHYRLKLVLTDGRVIWSDVVEARMDWVNNNAFVAFPNPTKGQLSIKALLPMEQAYTWQLCNGLGQVLHSGEMEGREVNISMASLPAGMYQLVMISPAGKRYLIKVSKQ